MYSFQSFNHEEDSVGFKTILLTILKQIRCNKSHFHLHFFQIFSVTEIAELDYFFEIFCIKEQCPLHFEKNLSGDRVR